MGHQELAQKEGFEVVRQLPAISSKAVYLAKKEGAFYILKWPEVAWDERQALRVWSGNAGPLFYDLHPDFFALQYLSGRNPYYWSEEDFPKLIRLLQKMQEYQPANPEDFRPLDDLVEKIEEKILASPLPQRKQAASDLLEAAKAAEGQMLIHGDLHPWNIFMRDAAHLIDPYGVCGDPGFDLAFLSASLANSQEEFLHLASEELQLPSAKLWFPGLVAYRLDCAQRHQEKSEGRVLEKLFEKVWGPSAGE